MADIRRPRRLMSFFFLCCVMADILLMMADARAAIPESSFQPTYAQFSATGPSKGQVCETNLAAVTLGEGVT